MKNAVQRAVLIAIAAALLLVPAMARARQRVDVRDATRLSIKYSWLGVAPPTKASVVRLTSVVIMVASVAPLELERLAGAVPVAVRTMLRTVVPHPEPLRGPPSSAF